jgi:hypothetical protein
MMISLEKEISTKFSNQITRYQLDGKFSKYGELECIEINSTNYSDL